MSALLPKTFSDLILLHRGQNLHASKKIVHFEFK